MADEIKTSDLNELSQLWLAAKQAAWKRVSSIPALSSGKPDLLAIASAEREQAASSDN